MASTVAWLDHDESQQRRMREVIQLFREQGAVDELGLGRIRDAFSDRLFPGTSVLWRRARYLLFVPWVYTLLGRGAGGGGSPEQRARLLQRRLAKALNHAAGENSGVIGASGTDVKQTPDGILWAALAAWGVRRDRASMRQVRDDAVAQGRRRALLEDGDEAIGGPWHPRVVRLLPDDFLEAASFDLTDEEAALLTGFAEAPDALPGTVEDRRRDGLLAVLVREGIPDNVDAPWQHPMRSASPELRAAVRHAGLFSDLAGGARLLYVDLVARSHGDTDSGLRAQIEAAFSAWAAKVEGDRFDELCAWLAEPDDFWLTVRAINPNIDAVQEQFVRSWGALVVGGDPQEVRRSPAAARLIAEREQFTKGARRARLMLDGSIGRDAKAVLPTRLDFRWAQASRIARDIRQEP